MKVGDRVLYNGRFLDEPELNPLYEGTITEIRDCIVNQELMTLYAVKWDNAGEWDISPYMDESGDGSFHGYEDKELIPIKEL